jgi:parallel beta-helix repeat protein
VRNLTQNTSYSTIQAAINEARNGDEIVVSPGTYRENISFQGKKITLRSTAPGDPSVVASTIIDGRSAGAVVTFSNGETREAVLAGFTIRNGSSSYGGGIYIFSASPTITGNTVQNNSAGYGGGIAVYHHSSPTITGNVIKGNSAYDAGGGIWIYGNSSPTTIGNTIEQNSARFGDGGGIFIYDNSSPTITGNTFRNNAARRYGGGIWVGSTAFVKDSHNTPWLRLNCPPSGSETNGVWVYRDNAFSANTHENGLESAGCHVYFD